MVMRRRFGSLRHVNDDASSVERPSPTSFFQATPHWVDFHYHGDNEKQHTTEYVQRGYELKKTGGRSAAAHLYQRR
jgi:hypothetical protein